MSSMPYSFQEQEDTQDIPREDRHQVGHLLASVPSPPGIVSGSPIGGLHFAQPTRCHPTTLNACYHVVLR
jgi:hypothetical protein